MKLNLVFLNNENGTFVIKVNDQEFVVDALSTQIPVDLSSDKANEIEIIEQPQSKITLLSWIGWALTLLLHGLINVIISYGDDMWYKQINPYLMSAKLSFPTIESSEICISFTSRKHKPWIYTTVECEQAQDVRIDSRPYPNAIYASYVGYVKKIVSMSSIGIALFAFLLYKMIAVSNTIGMLICVSLIVFFGFLDVLLTITQYFKAKKLYTMFTKTHGTWHRGRGTGDG